MLFNYIQFVIKMLQLSNKLIKIKIVILSLIPNIGVRV